MFDTRINIPRKYSLHILIILIIIGHSVGHQSWLDEFWTSDRSSTTFPYGIAIRMYLVFLKIALNTNGYQLLTETNHLPQNMACSFSGGKTPAASLQRRKWDLGIPIHKKMSPMINMFTTHIIYGYTSLVSNGAITLPLLVSLLGVNSNPSIQLK